jgi:hypothetical protein
MKLRVWGGGLRVWGWELPDTGDGGGRRERLEEGAGRWQTGRGRAVANRNLIGEEGWVEEKCATLRITPL